MTKRRLSSSSATYGALLLASLLLIPFGVLTVASFLPPPSPPSEHAYPPLSPMSLALIRVQCLTVWLLCGAAAWWLMRNLKLVSRDGTMLYVEHPLLDRAESVPLTAIASVREFRHGMRGKPALIVELSEPLSTGRRVIFLTGGSASPAWSWKPQPHPILVELQDVAAEPRLEPHSTADDALR